MKKGYAPLLALVSIGSLIAATTLTRCNQKKPKLAKVFDSAWQLVDTRFHDKSFNGLEWAEVKNTYRPLATNANLPVELYWRAINPMLALLESSHTYAISPRAAPKEIIGSFTTSMEVVEPSLGRCVGLWVVSGKSPKSTKILKVAIGSPAASAGIEAGWRFIGFDPNVGIGGEYRFLSVDGRKHALPALQFIVPSRSRMPREIIMRYELRRLAQIEAGPVETKTVDLPALGLTAKPGIAATPFTVAIVEPGSRAAAAGVAPGASVTLIDEKRMADGRTHIRAGFINPDGRQAGLDTVVSCRNAEDREVRITNRLSVGGVYIRFDKFSRGVANWALEHVPANPSMLILDFRRNTGGSVLEMQALLAGLLRRTVYIDRQVSLIPIRNGDPISRPMKIIILLGPISASAAEVTADALRAFGDAKIVGQRSAGEVELSKKYTLPDGGTIQIAEKSFLSSKGKALEGFGVAPDIEVMETINSVKIHHDKTLEAAILLGDNDNHR